MSLILALITTGLMGYAALLAIVRIKNPRDGWTTRIAIAISVGVPLWTVWMLYAQIPKA